MDTKTTDQIKDEAARLEQLCLLAAERHYAAETPWYRANYFLGIPSTIVAAIAGASAFSTFKGHEMVTAGIALLAAMLSALLTFLDPNKRATEHHATAKRYEALYHASGRFVRLTFARENIDSDAVEKALAALTTRFDEVLQSSPPLPGRSYKKSAYYNRGSLGGEVLRVPNSGDAKN
ncbi:MAG: SLATT domain-containing protein [Bryobacteraceae bacterium]